MSTVQNGKKDSTFWLCVCLILILISCIGASVLQTNFGSVRIIDLNIGTDRQQTLHALMFIPKNASADYKLPVVITCHGGGNIAEMQDAASIELSRRGVVVIAMDAYSHGMSSNIVDPGGYRAQRSVDGMGMIPLVEYVSSGILDFVDTSRIGVMGHSMGAINTVYTVRHYGRLYNAAIEEAMHPDSPGGQEITPEEQAHADSVNKIYAAFPTGLAPDPLPEVWNEIHCNIGYLFGLYEEASDRNRSGDPFLAPVSDEALMLMNSVRSEDEQLTSVEVERYYGNKNDGTLRVLYQPEVTHPWIHFSTRATADVIEFFTKVFDLDTSLSKTNQIWNIKHFFNFIGLIAIFVLLVPMAKLLMRIPCFASLSGKEPPKLPALTTKRKRIFWGGLGLIGAVSFFAAHLGLILSKMIFGPPYITRRIFFTAVDINPVAIWALLSGIFSMFWFWFIHKKVNNKNGVTEEMIGWKIDKKSLLKTFFLAVVIISCVYAIVALSRWAFMTDFRIWTPGLKTFLPDKLLPLVGYLPLFFVFYLSNSLLVNGAMRVDGMNEKRNILICGLGIILGPTIVWAIQYGTLLIRSNNTVMWRFDWVTFVFVSFCIPQVFVATYLNRYFFKATGKVWLGAMVSTIIMVMMTIMSTHLFGIFV